MRELEIYQKHFEGTNFAHTQNGILVLYLLRDGLVKNLRVRVKEPVTDDTEFQVTLNNVVIGTITIETGNYSSSTLDVDVAGLLFDAVVLNLTEVGTGEVISPIVLQVEVDENAVYPAKTKPIDADKVLVSDSEASNATKELDLENLRPLMQARTPDPTPVPIGGDGTIDLTGNPKSDIIVSGDGNVDTILLEKGETKTVTFSGIPLITYDASDLPITGNKDIQIVAGDKIQVVGGDDDIAYIEKHLPYSQQSVPRVTRILSSDTGGTVVPNLDTTDVLVIGVDVNTTIAAPIGTPRDKHELKIYITGPAFGPALTITYNAIYRAIGCRIPLGTDGTHIFRLDLSYNPDVPKWDIEYVTQQGTVWQDTADYILSVVELTGNKNVASGYCGLDGSGKVASAQLPSYVDDVLEYANLAAFPVTGETGKIYIAIDTGFEYRWSGSIYVRIVSSPGTTDALAEGSTNLYFTETRVRASKLTGFSATNTPITALDSVLQGMNKAQGQIDALIASAPYPLEVLMIPLSDLTSVLPDTALSSVQYGAVYFPMPYNFRILTTDVESSLRGLRLFANPNIPPPTVDVTIRVFVGGDEFTDAVHPISLPSGELDDDGTVQIATGTHDFNEGDIITAEYLTDGGTAGAGHILMLRGRRLP